MRIISQWKDYNSYEYSSKYLIDPYEKEDYADDDAEY